MEKRLNSYSWVGKISDNIGRLVNFNHSGTVYMDYKAMRHILSKHKRQLSRQNRHDPIGCIKRVIKKPEYVGTHPQKEEYSLELVSRVHGNNILVAIEVDKEGEYMYVASMYPITDAKLESRIDNGRIIKND